MRHEVERYDGVVQVLPDGVRLVECPSCGAYHREDSDVDCRNDEERFCPPEDPEAEAPYFESFDPRQEDGDG